jgi:hypothetical protein
MEQANLKDYTYRCARRSDERKQIRLSKESKMTDRDFDRDRDYDYSGRSYSDREDDHNRNYYGRNYYDRDYYSRSYYGRNYNDYDRYYYDRGYGDRNDYGRNYDRDYYRRNYYRRNYYGRSYNDYHRDYYGSSYYDRDFYNRNNYGQNYYDRDYDCYYRTYPYNRSTGRYSGVGPSSYTRSDDRIEEDVNERLTWHGDIDATDIQVDVNDGVVTLDGQVNSRWEKRMAEDVADSVSGVWDVDDKLNVRNKNRSQSRMGGAMKGKIDQGMEVVGKKG